jgi:DNA-binding CsgD family transcriptional regulator
LGTGSIRDIKGATNKMLPHLYAAASGDEDWTTFVTLLGEAAGAPKAHILYVNNAGPHGLRAAAPGIRQWIKHLGFSDQMLADAVRFGHMDGWLRASIYGPFPEGWVGRGSDLWPAEEMERTEYYRDVLRKYGFVRTVFSILLKSPGEIAACAVARGEKENEFDDGVLLLLRELNPHMRAAIRLYNRTGEFQQNLESLDLALEQFAIGVVVLDNTSNVIFANSFAQRCLNSRDGIFVEEGKIKTTSSEDFGQLRVSIERAIQNSEAALDDSPRNRSIGVAPIRRKHGPTLHAFVAPWLTKGQLALTRPAAVLLVTQPERRIPREAWLQTLYGLTQAESKLAALIAGGMDGPQAAVKLGLTAETVRTRLKTVFGKTNTTRQSDLARLLASLPHG